MSQPSPFGTTKEQDTSTITAQALQEKLEKAHLQLLQNSIEFRSWKLDSDVSDSEESDAKDPAIVAEKVAAQISFLRKLKFQYLEQNAKDKYVKTIVSDIDDAPMVTAEDNKDLLESNAAKKEKLKIAKANLVEMQRDIGTLAPLVERDYRRVEDAATEAAALAQKIIDARLALTRLRQTHPHPRLTIPLADEKLMDQVTEMQTLNDEVESVNQQVQAVKDGVKRGALELESLRVERTEVEKPVKLSRIDENDKRLAPLYDWYTASMALHCSMQDLHESHSASDNELRLTYNIENGQAKRHRITIMLIFEPDTRRLTAVQTLGLDELGIDVKEIVEVHLQVNDVHGVVAAILARARRRND